jgi:hypothetical protein
MSEINEPVRENTSQKSFFHALFDLKFTEWVTLRVAGVLYVILIVVIALFTLIGIVSVLFGGPSPAIIFVSILGFGLLGFLLILLTRLAFEASIATIAVAQNTASLRK